jgi:hypothetical protein
MPQDVRRVPTQSTDSAVEAEQVATLVERNDRPRVVADSLVLQRHLPTSSYIFLTVPAAALSFLDRSLIGSLG